MLSVYCVLGIVLGIEDVGEDMEMNVGIWIQEQDRGMNFDYEEYCF